MSAETATVVAAWVGAATGVGALAWNIIAWKLAQRAAQPVITLELAQQPQVSGLDHNFCFPTTFSVDVTHAEGRAASVRDVWCVIRGPNKEELTRFGADEMRMEVRGRDFTPPHRLEVGDTIRIDMTLPLEFSFVGERGGQALAIAVNVQYADSRTAQIEVPFTIPPQ